MPNYNTDVLKKSSPRPELVGLKPGELVTWRRVHAQEVLDYYADHGALFTMQEFNIKDFITLDNFLRSNVRSKPANKPAAGIDDKLKLRLSVLEAGIAEVRRDARELKESYGSFVPAVADSIVKKYIVPGIINGLRQAIELPDELEKADV